MSAAQHTGHVGYLETLNRDGSAESRLALDAGSSLLIGRGYNADLILDDAYVSPEHATLTIDGEGAVQLRDSGSDNGTLVDGKALAADGLELRDDQLIRVGRTLLRYRSVSHAVAPALKDAATGKLLSTLARPAIALGLIVAGLLVSYFSIWLDTSDRDALDTGLVALLGLGVGTVVWASIWSLVGRLNIHEARWLQHVAIAVICVAVGVFQELLIWVGSFALQLDAALGQITYWSVVALLILAVCLHLRLASVASTRSIVLRVSAVVVLAAGGLQLIDSFGDGDDAHRLQFGITVAPAALALGGADDIDSVQQSITELARRSEASPE